MRDNELRRVRENRVQKRKNCVRPASSNPFVGSSAIRSRAREQAASAIVTRCAMPPES